MAQMDWANVLDFKTAAKNVRGELFGDWYHDPWEWPEIDFLLASPKRLGNHIDSTQKQSPALIDAPKENWA